MTGIKLQCNGVLNQDAKLQPVMVCKSNVTWPRSVISFSGFWPLHTDLCYLVVREKYDQETSHWIRIITMN